MFGMAYMFVHDGLVHRRFPVGPIANVPYLRKVAAAHYVSYTLPSPQSPSSVSRNHKCFGIASLMFPPFLFFFRFLSIHSFTYYCLLIQSDFSFFLHI